MRLETNRLILRLWGKEDEQRLFELAKNPNVGPPCGWIAHQNLEESQMVLQDILMNDYTFAIVQKHTGDVIGNIAIMPYCESRFAQNENEAELGFWLGYPYWGNGYMPEAVECLLTYGFHELKLKKIWCAHNVDNHNSMRVQQKCGFEFHHDEDYYSKELDKRVYLKVNYRK